MCHCYFSRYFLIVQAELKIRSDYFYSCDIQKQTVVVWCDSVGGIQWRAVTLSWSGSSRNGGAARDWQENEQTHQCCLH